MNDHTLIQNQSGSVECRICGLTFVPESKEDQETHEHEHRVLICGGLPLKVREFLRSFGWAVAHNDGGIERQIGQSEQEIGKRAVVFGYWGRALANGIPENDFNKFMAAHFAFVDAHILRDERLVEIASKAIKPWEKYAG